MTDAARKSSGREGAPTSPATPAAPAARLDVRRVATLQSLLAIEATALVPALAEATQRINDAFGADKTDVFLHEARRRICSSRWAPTVRR